MAEIPKFLASQKSTLPDFANIRVRENPDLYIGLDIADTALRRGGIDDLSALTLYQLIALVKDIQAEIVTSFGERGSAVRQVSNHEVWLYTQHWVKRPIPRNHVLFMAQSQREAETPLSPTAIAETVGIGLLLLDTIQRARGNVELLSAHNTAAAETAALLSKISGARMDYCSSLGNGGYSLSDMARYGFQHNRFTIIVADQVDVNTLGQMMGREARVAPLGGHLILQQNPPVLRTFRNGFYQ